MFSFFHGIWAEATEPIAIIYTLMSRHSKKRFIPEFDFASNPAAISMPLAVEAIIPIINSVGPKLKIPIEPDFSVLVPTTMSSLGSSKFRFQYEKILGSA